MAEVLFYGFLFLLFGIPFAAVIWFVVSLVKLLKSEKGSERRKSLVMWTIISGAAALALVGIVAALVTAFMYGIAHM